VCAGHGVQRWRQPDYRPALATAYAAWWSMSDESLFGHDLCILQLIARTSCAAPGLFLTVVAVDKTAYWAD
jgi:hypothetical protein